MASFFVSSVDSSEDLDRREVSLVCRAEVEVPSDLEMGGGGIISVGSDN